jgi:hypothetical protein
MSRLFIGFAMLISSMAQTQAPPYQRGNVVRLHEVATPAEFKVVGIAGDRIRADETGVYVNDMPVIGFSREFLTRWKFELKEVLQRHYFVMGEQRLNNDVIENVSFVPESSLERVR